MAAAAMTVGVWAAAPPADAGQWMQVSCQNPDYSVAPSQGWAVTTLGDPVFSDNLTCTSDTAMTIGITAPLISTPVGAAAALQYTPPPGSTLTGGYIDGGLTADDLNNTSTVGTATLSAPSFSDNGGDAFEECTTAASGCKNGSSILGGIQPLPTNTGGDLFVGVGCVGTSGSCTWPAGNGSPPPTWVGGVVYSADLLLDNSSAPTATGFGGTLLQPTANGTASLTFAADDANGPGVYQVVATIDGLTSYKGTPNTNGGDCVPVGTDTTSGALMFDYRQPCLQSETVDVPINTAPFADGNHDLKVTVIDAAGNSSVVYQGTVTTDNTPASTSLPDTTPAYKLALLDAPHGVKGVVHRSYKRSAITLSGKLSTGTGATAIGVPVTLWTETAGSSAFTKLAQTTTSSTGTWTVSAPAGPSRVLRVVSGADAQPTSTTGVASITETVAPTLSLRIDSRGNLRLVFTGRLGITPLGSPRPLVFIEGLTSSGWQVVGSPVRVDSSGRYRYVYDLTPNALGRRFAFRAITPEVPEWTGAHSRTTSAVVQ